MKELLQLLGLAENATKAEILKVAADLKAELDLVKGRVVHAFDPALVAAKVSAGLSRGQAIEVLRKQAEHDASLTEVSDQKAEATPTPEATETQASSEPTA